MACADIVGKWIEGVLVVDITDDVLFDPSMRISLDSGNYKVKFTGDNGEFPVKCETNGNKTTIEFTRTHDDKTTTTYSGRVVDFGARGTGIIRGRFKRNTPTDLATERGILAQTGGDWETEKPT